MTTSARSLIRIDSDEHENFSTVFELLWAEFGAKNEMEHRDVLRERFSARPRIFYEMLMAIAEDGGWAAVCDYSIIAPESPKQAALVHLSHTLVHPDHRRAGLAGEMMAYAAGRAAELFGAEDVLLIAESERDDPQDPACAARLRAFDRLGLLLVDPSVVDYHQPDFSDPPDSRDTSPVPMLLFVARPFRSAAKTIPCGEIREAVARLYGLYGRQLSETNMRHRLLDVSRYPGPEAQIRLLAPTDAILKR